MRGTCLLSAPEKVVEGQPTKKHLLEHLCAPSLELGSVGHEGALRYARHTEISLHLVRQI